MHTRAERREIKSALKSKAKKVYPWMKCPQKLADNLKSCSCFVCGNPRKWWNQDTLKEKRFKALPIDTE